MISATDRSYVRYSGVEHGVAPLLATTKSFKVTERQIPTSDQIQPSYLKWTMNRVENYKPLLFCGWKWSTTYFVYIPLISFTVIDRWPSAERIPCNCDWTAARSIASTAVSIKINYESASIDCQVKLRYISTRQNESTVCYHLNRMPLQTEVSISG